MITTRRRFLSLLGLGVAAAGVELPVRRMWFVPSNAPVPSRFSYDVNLETFTVKATTGLCSCTSPWCNLAHGCRLCGAGGPCPCALKAAQARMKAWAADPPMRAAHANMDGAPLFARSHPPYDPPNWVLADTPEARASDRALVDELFPDMPQLRAWLGRKVDPEPIGVTEPVAMHADCIPCLARCERSGATRESEAIVLLIMYLRGELEDAYDDLCFEHRRRIDEALGRYAGPCAG